MANSDETMSRLDNLEEGVRILDRSVASLNRAMVQVSEILIDQNQLIDHVSARVDEVGARIEHLDESVQGTNQRLDRLIGDDHAEVRNFDRAGRDRSRVRIPGTSPVLETRRPAQSVFASPRFSMIVSKKRRGSVAAVGATSHERALGDQRHFRRMSACWRR
jgi:hypothetical protein